MRNYELTLVFSDEAQEEKLQELLGEIAGFVQGKGGLLGRQQVRREGKAPIGVLSCTLLAETLPEIEKLLKAKKEVVRFMLAKAVSYAQETPVLTKPMAQVSEEPKVAIEDIDKKLEEIFKETL